MICELNLDENWMDFKKNFEIFLKMLGNDIEPNQVKGAMLLYTIRERALKIFHATLISSQDKHKNLKSHRSYDFVHSLKRNVVQERYIFNTTVQAKNEPFDSFVKHLKKLIKNCDYGDQTDNLLCDRIVLGVTDKTLQEMLLQLPNLTLEKAIDYCKFVEAIRFQQLKALNVQIDNECSGESNSINEHQSNSSELNLTKAKPTFEEENHFETPAAVDFPRIKEEVQSQSNSILLNLLEDVPSHEEVNRYKTPTELDFHRIKEEVQDEDDFDHTVPSECSLVVSTEDIQLKTETNVDDDDSVIFISTEEQFPSIENTTRTIESTTNHLLSNTLPQHNYIGLSELLTAPCKIPAIHDQVDGDYNNYDKQYVQASYTDTPGMDVSYTHNSQELFMHKGNINTPFSMTNTSSSDYENIQQLAQENTERSLDESLLNMSSHQMNFNVVHNHSESHSGSAATNMPKTKHKPFKPKIYICEECHRQFSRLSGLKTHLLIHKGEKPCKCKDCGRNFRDKTILRRHRQRIHHDTTVSYKCPNCDKTFFEKSYLLRHLQNESGEKRFHCKECNKSYTEMSSYRRHVRLHGGNKPFKCDLCNQRFTAICNVRQHKLTQHSRIFPFKCPECGKRFSRKFLLKKHVEKHSSEIVILVD